MSALAVPMRTLTVFVLATIWMSGRATSPATAQDKPDEPTNIAAKTAGVDAGGKYRIEKGLGMFAGIQDDAFFPWRNDEPPADEKMRDKFALEERAYDEVIRHARQFPTAELEAHARRDVRLKDLYDPIRADFKLDLIYFEGRLRSLRRANPTRILAESGVTNVYEAWMYPTGETEPLCLFVTELPAGLKPPERADELMDAWVGVAGYSFKLMRYESRKVDPKNPERNVIRRVPVLMGRSLTPVAAPVVMNGAVWRQAFLPLMLGLIVGVGLLLAGLAWWFRRNDRAVQQLMDEKRNANPFAVN